MTTGRSTQSINCCVIAKGTERVNNAVGRSRKRRGGEGKWKGATAFEYYSSSSYFLLISYSDLFPTSSSEALPPSCSGLGILFSATEQVLTKLWFILFRLKPCGRCFWACTQEKRRVALIVLWSGPGRRIGPAASTGSMALDIENWGPKGRNGEVFGHSGHHTTVACVGSVGGASPS